MKLFKFAPVLALLGVLFCATPGAFAVSSWTNSYGENSRDYGREAGAAWYYYKMKNNNYGPDDKIYVPVSGSDTKVAIPAGTCQSYGGFWVLLRNGYNYSTKTYIDTPAAAVRLSDIALKDLPASAKNDIARPTDVLSYQVPKNVTIRSEGALEFKKNDTMNNVWAIYQNYQNTSAVPQAAKDDIGELSYFCAGEGTSPSATTKMSLHSFTTVSIGEVTSAPVLDNTSYYGSTSNATVIVPIGEKIPTVTFRSYVARPSTDYQINSGSISYRREPKGSSLPTANSSITYPADNKDTWNINGVEYLYTSLEEVSISNLGNMSGKITVCQDYLLTGNNAYTANRDLTRDNSKTVQSSACITFYPVSLSSSGEPSSGIVTECGAGGNGGSSSNRNVATVGVSKNGASDSPGFVKTTAAPQSDSIAIFAKPGDSIRFSYAICFNTVDDHRNRRSDRYFEISAGVGGGDSTNATLFGKQFNLLGNRLGVVKSYIANGRFVFEYADETTHDDDDTGSIDGYYKIPNSSSLWTPRLRQLAFTSPDSREGDVQPLDPDADNDVADEGNEDESYDCEYYTGRTTDKGGFVIPGLLPSSANKNDLEEALKHCNSSNALADNSNSKFAYSAVGATIGQSLQYGIKNGTNVDSIDKSAAVKVPYNYIASLTGKIEEHDAGVVYPGEVIKYDANVDILPRQNPLTSDKDENGEYISYATNTPPYTRVELVEFLIEDDVELGNVSNKLTQDYNEWAVTPVAGQKPNNALDVCEFYSNILGKDLTSCKSRVVKGDGAVDAKDDYVGNRTSDPKGEMGYYQATERLTVPDTVAGYKYCAATAINYGDSHNAPDQALSADPNSPYYGANSYSVNSGFTTRTSTRWRVSKASCRTVAKKPSAEVWNGGTYSSGDIWSSVTKKSVNARLGDLLYGTEIPKGYKGILRAAPSYAYFGSWDEYYVVAKGSVYGFASASALGYTTNFGSLSSDGYGNPDNRDFCDLSRLTIANDKCRGKNGTAGEQLESNNAARQDEPNSVKDTLKNFYTPPDYVESSSPSDGTVAWLMSSMGGYNQKYYDWRRSHVIMASGNVTINNQLKSWTSGTIVIMVNGHLTINDNICITEGTCSAYYGTKNLGGVEIYDKDVNDLSLKNRNTTPFYSDNISAIPQVILIADSISIGSDVTQLDAWLVTIPHEGNSDSDFVNTCDGFQSGVTDINRCWKTLKINGPVLTSELLLNRTGGAWAGYSGDLGSPVYQALKDEKQKWQNDCEKDPNNRGNIDKIKKCVNGKIESTVNSMAISDDEKTVLKKAYLAADSYGAEANVYTGDFSNTRDLTCDGSISPAEILDLHPLVYIWAYYQSQQLGLANIINAQELSPRY